MLPTPGVVPEPESQVSPEREGDAGQQECLSAQILLRGCDRRGAAHSTSSSSEAHRLSLLGYRLALQVSE